LEIANAFFQNGMALAVALYWTIVVDAWTCCVFGRISPGPLWQMPMQAVIATSTPTAPPNLLARKVRRLYQMAIEE
jgi:hypothetical protein